MKRGLHCQPPKRSEKSKLEKRSGLIKAKKKRRDRVAISCEDASRDEGHDGNDDKSEEERTPSECHGHRGYLNRENIICHIAKRISSGDRGKGPGDTVLQRAEANLHNASGLPDRENRAQCYSRETINRKEMKSNTSIGRPKMSTRTSDLAERLQTVAPRRRPFCPWTSAKGKQRKSK